MSWVAKKASAASIRARASDSEEEDSTVMRVLMLVMMIGAIVVTMRSCRRRSAIRFALTKTTGHGGAENNNGTQEGNTGHGGAGDNNGTQTWAGGNTGRYVCSILCDNALFVGIQNGVQQEQSRHSKQASRHVSLASRMVSGKRSVADISAAICLGQLMARHGNRSRGTRARAA